ncbi:unnamed protein product [Lepeophtheirus salmonis]|uniref:(salmon louse) hypothetical protein n=1 Tax=Lepeophtheirus salmonis TaxID=72036 RepID=A0A7R8H9P5_LEPSM|nr:unnamed protein product [Lepeophtheirus salmonis]CAF2964462.1 unnamed protein product [Lepeophtheirus salmonis]
MFRTEKALASKEENQIQHHNGFKVHGFSDFDSCRLWRYPCPLMDIHPLLSMDTLHPQLHIMSHLLTTSLLLIHHTTSLLLMLLLTTSLLLMHLLTTNLLLMHLLTTNLLLMHLLTIHPLLLMPLPNHNQPEHYAPPKCSKGNPNTYCVEDSEYPTYEIEHALEYHYDAVQQIYKDVLANTENSVDRLKSLVEETYLCPSETKLTTKTLTQTTRVEHCSTPGSHCPLVPECYETKCVQKSIYHRFLTYDPYDQYLPFAIESFKLPASCACYNGAFAESH